MLDVDVTHVDNDGDVFGKPAFWNEARLGPSPVILLESSRAVPGPGARVQVKIEPCRHEGPATFKGRVIRELIRSATKVVGIFRKSSTGGRIIPSGKKERDDVLVPHGEHGDAKDGELVVGLITRQRGRGPAQARVSERLGSADDPRNTSLIAIHSYGIPDVFPKAVDDDVARLKSFRIEGREDLRHIPFITIDPADARDHDDAIWAEASEGGHNIMVAIADVAAYVQPGSAIDREARKRGNSTYFPDRVVPMLPERISNDLCSLKTGQDRPALVCRMTVDRDGKKQSHSFSRAIIRVAEGLSYENAQAIADGRLNHVLRDTAITPLWAAYHTLSKARDQRGPLDLDLPERKVILSRSGHVERIVVPERLTAHRLVEEFMIQANVAAAEQLKAKKAPLLYRVHEEPSTEKLRALQEFLRTTDIPFALGQVVRAKHFNRILEAAEGSTHQRVVHEVVLRSQAQAVYHPVNGGHFGLSLTNYAHFTSPIRRYADLIVHRSLIKALKFGNDGLTDADIASLEDTAEKISATERRSMLAERETMDRLVASFLGERLGEHFKARISGVVGAGLFIVLNETGADGFVPASSLGRDYFVLDPVRHALAGTKSGETFQLGDDVEVRLMEVAPIRGGMRFEMLTDGKIGAKPQRVPRGLRPKPKGRKRR
jgi:ribonuclease R